MSVATAQGDHMSRGSIDSMWRTMSVVLTIISKALNTASAQDVALVIEHVAVVDVIAGRVQPDMTVEIQGRTVVAMNAGHRMPAPHGATLIDGRGKYLIPGLWDMHVHTSWPPGGAQVFLPIMVANGVLGARDMHGSLSTVLSLKHALASGTQIGPRLLVAGPAVDGPNSTLPGARVVHTADEARETVRQLKASGVDFIKVYSSLPKELYFALASEAKEQRIRLDVSKE